MHFIPQTAFRILLDLVLILKKRKNYWIVQLGMQRIGNISENTFYYPHKQYKGNNAQIFPYLLFRGVFLVRRNKISNVSIKRYAEIGSPWRAPYSKLKYWVVVPPFITHESWSFNKISVHVINFLPNPKFPQDGTNKIMVNRVKSFFSIHSY